MRRAITVLVVLLSFGAAVPAVAAASSTLGPGATLAGGGELYSPDGHYGVAMQTDGNLIEFITGGRLLWASGTAGDDGARAVMQENGNLALYDPSGAAVWSSNSHTTGCPQLVVQDDGNVVIYAPKAIWATHTLQDVLEPGDILRPGWAIYNLNEEFRLIMQGDGNLVLYDADGHALWATGTNRHPGAWATMQTDGNLVVYDSSHHALWASNTSGHDGASATLQNDGNFVIYQSGKALWDSKTNGKGKGGWQGPPAPAPANCTPPPAQAPAPPPAAPVVKVPVSTTIPVARRHLKVRLVLSWTWDYGTTWLSGAKIGRVPAHTRLAVDCMGRGCPSNRKAHAAGVRRLRRLLKALEGRSYQAGDRLMLTLTAPGYLPERAEITFRDGRLPRIRLLRR